MAPQLVRLEATAASTTSCRASSRTSTCGRRSASIRCWSAAIRSDLVDLHADPCAGAEVGRVVPARRHRRAGAGAGGAVRGPRRHDPPATPPSREILTRNGAGAACSRPTGARSSADIVASNADVVHTYERLLRQDARGARRGAAACGQQRFSMSLFLIYFGTRRQHPHLAHHNVIFGPRYRELLDDIFERGMLADDFSLYLHAPTRDRSVAGARRAARRSTCCRRCPTSAGTDRLERRGPALRDRILDYLEARYIPGLRADLVTAAIFTPLDFDTRAQRPSGLGVLAGAAPDPERLVPGAQPRRRIGGLYFVGAGTHPGAGVPGVVAAPRRPPA